MARNEQGTITLAEATARVLAAEGTQILLEPERFARMACDATGNAQTPQTVLFQKNCDEELLAPFVQVAVGKEVQLPALQDAATKVADILHGDRGVIPDLSSEIAGQLMAGIARYAKNAKNAKNAETANATEKPSEEQAKEGNVSEEPPKREEADKKEKSASGKKGKSKPVLIIAAIAVGVLVLVVLVGAVVLPQFRASVTLYDYRSGKSTDATLDGWKGGTVVLPEAIAEDEGGGEFVGWSTSSEQGNGDVLAPGTEVNIEDTSTYYAVWNPKITFDGNGATSGSMEPLVVEEGKEFELPECKYAKEGQVFAGWLSPDNKDELYALRPGDKTKAFESTTYRAKWTPKPSIAEISIAKIGDMKGNVDGWNPKTGIVAMLVKNDTKENIRLEADTTFQSEAGNKITDYHDFINVMAPGETTLIAWSVPSDEEDVAKVAYAINASKAYDWAKPLGGSVKHEVMSKDKEKLKVKLTNSGNLEADIERLTLVAKDKAGTPYIFRGSTSSDLKQGESAEVTFDKDSAIAYGLPAPAWDQLECTFYINGYNSTI